MIKIKRSRPLSSSQARSLKRVYFILIYISINFVVFIFSGKMEECNRKKYIDIFFKVLDVKTLTSELEVECIEENTRPSPSVQSYMHRAMPYIQRFMASKRNFNKVYHQLKKEKIHSKLSLLNFFQVRHIRIILYFQLNTVLRWVGSLVSVSAFHARGLRVRTLAGSYQRSSYKWYKLPPCIACTC